MRNIKSLFLCLAKIVTTALFGLVLFSTNPVYGQSDAKLAYVYWFDWSDDGTRIAVATPEGIQIYNARFELISSRSQPDPSGGRQFAALSPDGTRLTTENAVWDTKSLQSLFQVDTTEYPLGDWSRDGTQVSGVVSGARAIAIYNGFTGQQVKIISTGDYPLLSNPHWSPDNRYFAFNTLGKRLVIVDAAQGETIAQYRYESFVSSITWSPDSKKLAMGSFTERQPGTSDSTSLASSPTGAVRYSIDVVDISNGMILHTIDALPQPVNYIRWSPDGTQLVATVGAKQVYVWDTINWQLRGQYDTPGGLVGIKYSPFGGQVMMGFNFYWLAATPRSSAFTPQSIFVQTRLGGAIQIVVPAPSLERLQGIARSCGLPKSTAQSLTTSITPNRLNTFMDAVRALPAGTIPPACAADLLAVAEALQKQ
jgi:WD40 repeat protein